MLGARTRLRRDMRTTNNTLMYAKGIQTIHRIDVLVNFLQYSSTESKERVGNPTNFRNVNAYAKLVGKKELENDRIY